MEKERYVNDILELKRKIDGICQNLDTLSKDNV